MSLESLLRLNHYGNELQQLKVFSDLYYTQVDPFFNHSDYQQNIKACCLRELPVFITNQSKYAHMVQFEQLQDGLCPGEFREKMSKNTRQFRDIVSTSVFDLDENETVVVKNCNYSVPPRSLALHGLSYEEWSTSSSSSASSRSLYTYSPVYPNGDLHQALLKIPLVQSHCIRDVYLASAPEQDGTISKRGLAHEKSRSLKSATDGSRSERKGKKLLGGSNFDISWRLPHYFGACNVVDNFDMTYQIYCPLDLAANLSHTRERSSVMQRAEAESFLHCGELRIVLQHEYFDAYKYAEITEALAFNEVVFQDTVCAYINMTEISSLLLQSNSQSHTVSVRSTTTPFLPSASPTANRYFWRQVTKSTLLHPATKTTYEWRPDDPIYLAKPFFHACMKHKKVHLVGSSHMRYLSDYYADLYIDHMKIDRKHKDLSYQDGWSYYYITYAYNMILFLDSLECTVSESDGESATEYLVLQNSEWDMQYYHPSSYITNPEQGLGVICAIERMKARGCESKYRIVYLTAMPHPANPPIVSKGWRNHAAIKAVNQFMVESLKKIGYRHLSILDVNSLLLARYLFHPQLVCYDHFLCQDNGVITTKGGVAYALDLLQEICVDEIAQVSNDHAKAIQRKKEKEAAVPGSLSANKGEAAHDETYEEQQLVALTHPKFYYNSDIIHVLSRSAENATEIENKTYILDYGCFRDFPDERVHFIDRSQPGHSDTDSISGGRGRGSQLLPPEQQSTSQHHYVLDLTEHDPKAYLSFCLPYPSLADGMLYQAPLGRQVFVIDSGFKRAIANRKVFLAYLNITNTTDPVIETVSQFYLNSIPTGKLLKNAEDLRFVRLRNMKNVTIIDGAVYRVNRDMYIIDQGKRRHIASWKAFTSLRTLGIDLANVTNVMSEQMVKVPEGPKLRDVKELKFPKLVNLSIADGSVYGLNKNIYIVDMGVLRPIASWRAFQTFGIDASAIKQVSVEQLNRIPMGVQIRHVNELTYPKYANLSTEDGRVYQVNKKIFIVDMGVRRPLASWKVFESLHSVGIHAADIKPATPEQISKIPEGNALKSVDDLAYPKHGKLPIVDGAVYRVGREMYVIDEGVRRFISSWPLFLALGEVGIDESKVRPASREQIEAIPEGPKLKRVQDLRYPLSSAHSAGQAKSPGTTNDSTEKTQKPELVEKINPADGTLLKVKKDMYVVDEGRRRHIASWKVFLSLNEFGIRLRNATSVTREQLTTLPEGRPLRDFHDLVYLQKNFNVTPSSV